MNCTKKLSVLKSVFGLMPLLCVVIGVWTALSHVFFSLSNLFLSLCMPRENDILATRRNTNPEKNLKYKAK